MEDNCDSGVVPSLSFVVENIYSSCDIEKNNAVSASTLVDFMRPLMFNHPTGIAELMAILDPNNENPSINRSTFYESMKKWTANINGNDNSLSNFSFRESDVSDEKELPFHQSTPKPSLDPSSMQNIPNLLNFSNFSATSFSSYNKSGSTVACEKLFLEEKVKELEHKYGNALNELFLVKSQLTASEEQYADLKQDLDRTNRRLLLEQQVIADLQKSMVHNDDFREEINNTRKENEHLQKMWASAKKENSNLNALIRDLEFEKEQFERKMSDIRNKDDQRKQELTDLQTALSLTEEENRTLKKVKNELEDKVDQQMSLLKHFTEMSEFMKNENETLRLVVKKTGLIDLSNPSSLKDLPNLSPHGTPTHSPKSSLLKTISQSSTPFKNMYHPSIFNREIFNSPHFIRQLQSPVSPNSLDTPTNLRLISSSSNVNNSTMDASKALVKSNGVKHSPKKDKGIESLHSDCPKNSKLVNSLGDIADKEYPNISNKTDTPSPTLSSGNAVCETFEDLDLSVISEKLSSKGQDLHSELTACKLLDNSDECFVADHMELSKIAKEHESCFKIIDEYQQRIEVLVKDIEMIETKHTHLLVDYNSTEEHSKCLEKLLNKEKSINEHLALKNFDLTKQVTNLIDAVKEKETKLHELIDRTRELKEETDNIKNEKEYTYSQYTTQLEKYDSLMNEKITLENQLEQIKAKNALLLNEKSYLHTENKNLTNTFQSKDKEILELQNTRTECEQLKIEMWNTKLEQLENCRTIGNLTEKLEQSKDMGKHFMQIIKKKLIAQNTKVEILNELNRKLQQHVDDLKIGLDHMKTEFYQDKSSAEEASFNYKHEGEVNVEDESTSTEGSETNSERPKFKKKQNYIRRSNYEKQQLKIIKLEELVELLQSELFNEKIKTQKICGLEHEVNNLGLEKNNLEQNKNIISRELDVVKHELSSKELIMKQIEESYKFEVDSLSQTFLKEKEIISKNLLEAQQEARKNDENFKKKIEELEKEVMNSKEEKKCLENLLDKQETKIITLKKVLSDITKSSEEEKVFENIVVEKESILQFNRELLVKSNNSLQLSEDCICSLKLLLDQCKMVLLETADDLFSATKEAFGAWKNNLKIVSEDNDLITAMEPFEMNENDLLSEFTEEKIEKVNCNLILSAKLLRALAQKSGTMCLLCKNNGPAFKGVNKFTLRPSKLQFLRMPSSDPDISSSCMKGGESPQEKDNTELNILEDNKNDLMAPKILKQNDSISEWLGHRTNSLREALKNRKMTEKKFYHLASTWKSTLENAKNKYYNLKHQCSKVRDSYLRILLQIVTYLKNHKCHQEQKSLIQALKLIEKLKDLIFDVFKLAEQFGASRQELHSMKCWHFIVEYVNGVHKENEQLRLFQYISVQMRNNSPRATLRLRDVSTETENFDDLLELSSVGDLNIREATQSTLTLEVPRRRSSIRLLSEKCTAFGMMLFSIICFLAMFLIYLHLECVRNGNGSIVCPLDFLVSVRRVQSEFHPH